MGIVENVRVWIDGHLIDAAVMPFITTDELDDDTCACGNSLEDSEGYDGRCGTCADRADKETEEDE